MNTIYRQPFGAITREATEPEPTPTVVRVPRAYDGCTWHAYASTADGEKVGATARTKREALAAFSEQWARFA